MKIGMRRLQLFILLFAASSLLFHSPSDFEAFAASPSDIGAADAETDGNNGFDRLTNVRDVSTFTVGSSTYAIAVSKEGVQMIDISDPTNILATDAETDGVNSFTELSDPRNVETFTIGSSTYAIVVAFGDHGVQIIDVSDPTDIVAKDAVNDEDTDSNGDTFEKLRKARGVDTFTIGSSTYAIVVAGGTGSAHSGVQIIDVSDPTNILATDAVGDGDTDSNGGTFVLGEGTGVSTFTIGSSTYAIVTDNNDHGVQIIDVSDPTNILATDAEIDGANGFTELNGAAGVDTFTIGSSTYAIVTGVSDDGVQIIDVSDPTDIVATDAVNDGDTDSNGSTFSMLNGARDVSIFTIDSSTSTNTYAIVTGMHDDGVQIIDVSDPTNILATDAETDDNKDADSPFTALDLVGGVDTFIINSVAYAIVLGYNDHGVQMIELGNCASSDCVYTAAAAASSSTSSTCSRHVILGNCGTIAINNDVYRIIDTWTNVPTTEVLVGQPVTVTLSTPNNPTHTKIHFASVHTEVFSVPLNYEQSAHIDYSIMSDSYSVTKAKLFQVAAATHRITEDPDVKNLEMFEVVFTMIFAQPMDTSHVVVETKNKHGIPETLYLMSALKVNENLVQALTLEEKSKFSIVDPELAMKPLGFVDPEKDPSHYVKRYLTEPKYKEWFDRYFPTYTIYDAIGITFAEYQEIESQLVDPEPEMEMDPEPEQTKKEKSKRQRR